MKNRIGTTVVAVLATLGLALLLAAGAEARQRMTVGGIAKENVQINRDTDEERYREELVSDDGAHVGWSRIHVERDGRYLDFTSKFHFENGRITASAKMLRGYYLKRGKATLKIVDSQGRFHGISGHVSSQDEGDGRTKHTFRYKLPPHE